MAENYKRLLRTPRPEHDESFGGYITRLTEANDYLSSSWILSLAGIRCGNGSSIHYLVFQDDLDLSMLARLIGLDVSELLPLTYPPVVTELNSTSKHQFFGLPVRKQVIRVNKAKICPSCLRETNYCRRLWDLIPVTVCHFHKCLLIDACPKCNKGITWARKYLCSCPCWFDWRDVPSVAIDDSELEVGRHIYSLCNRITGLGGDAFEQKMNPLLRLNLDDYISALLFIAGQYVGLRSGKGHHITRSKNNSEIHSLLNRALSVFQNWPHNFYQFLDWRKSQQGSVMKGHGLERDFGRFHYFLHRFLSSSNFDFMRTAYDEYVKISWLGGYSSRSRFLKGSNLSGRYISKASASSQLGIHGSTIDKLIQNGKLDCIIKENGERPVYLIEASSLEKIKAELPNLIPLYNAASMLGMTSEQVLELLRNGVLAPLRGPGIDGYRTWVFSRSTLENFLGNAERLQFVQGH
jgi:hypothetical protein